MATLSSLPTELHLQIIEYVHPHRSPMGTDDTLVNHWGAEASVRLDPWMERPMETFQEPENHSTRRDKLRASLRRVLSKRKTRTANATHDGVYGAIQALRGTNRHFAALCTPILFEELRLASQKKSGKRAMTILKKHAHQVKSLHIAVVRSGSASQQRRGLEAVQAALAKCVNTTELRIYFDELDETEESRAYAEMIAPHVESLLVKQRRLSAFGFYSIHLLRVLWGSMVDGMEKLAVLPILSAVLNRMGECPWLTDLDIRSPSFTRKAYESIKSNSGHLHSMTFRRCLRGVGSMWETSAIYSPQWASNSNLTRLNLINCEAADALAMPHLVRHFPQLKHLLISGCGTSSDVIPPVRSPGWSKRPNAICMQRPPLEILFVEHMDKGEILAMGPIPATTVIVTALVPGHLLHCFDEDPEIFPGLRILRYEDMSKTQTVRRPLPERPETMKRIIARREFIVTDDARSLASTRGNEWAHDYI